MLQHVDRGREHSRCRLQETGSRLVAPASPIQCQALQAHPPLVACLIANIEPAKNSLAPVAPVVEVRHATKHVRSITVESTDTAGRCDCPGYPGYPG